MTNIVLGDCTKELKKIESNTVDLIIADPPYNVGKDYGNKSDKQDFDEYIASSAVFSPVRMPYFLFFSAALPNPCANKASATVPASEIK